MLTGLGKSWGPVLLCFALLLAAGCSQPLERTTQQQLREQLVASHRAYLQAVAAGPVIEVSRTPSEVELELTPERRAQLDNMSGPTAYRDLPLDLGANLLADSEVQSVQMSLLRALHLAAMNNLTVELAKIQPGISQAQLVAAQAVFDAVYFFDLDYQTLDTPRPSATVGAFGTQRQKTTSFTTGIRKPLTTGGELTAQTSINRQWEIPTLFAVNAFETTSVTLGVTQPLLRNFGADVNQAQISLSRNALDQSVAQLRGQMLETIFQTEEAYWMLVFARQQLKIRSRLLERTIEDRDQLKKRLPYDVSPVRMTEANSFVELRRADVIRARQLVRVASDRLKQLINADNISVADETLIIPIDNPADLPVEFNLLDAVTTALKYRPELEDALSQIQDASIRLRVADNQLLPALNLGASIRYNGLGSNVNEAYDLLSEAQFIDYLLNLQFEYPLGNRAAQAVHTQRELERRAAVVNYQQQAQVVVLQVKESLRSLISAYQLIGAARAARRAAADNLRAIEEQERAGVALTPEFLLDLKLSTQARLAEAEVQEVQALSDYNTSIAQLYRTMGTLLQRNNIVISDIDKAGLGRSSVTRSSQPNP